MGQRAALALGVFALLPLYRLTHQSFWYDELFTVWVARQPPAEILEQAAADGYTPPLYYILVGALWRAGVQSENLRILSVLAGGLALWSLARLGRRLGGRPAAYLVLALGGLSPFLFSFAQELRPYTAFLALTAGATEAFLAWWRKPRYPLALACGALLLAATCFSYVGLLLPPVALAAATRAPRRRAAIFTLALVTAVSWLMALPGWKKATAAVVHRFATGSVRFPGSYPFPLARLILGNGVRMPPLADEREGRLKLAAEGAGGLLLAAAAWVGWRRRDMALAFALAGLTLAVASISILDAVTGVGITTRYLTLAYIPFLLVVALTVRRLGRPGTLFLAPVVFLEGIGLERYLFHAEQFRDDWRRLCARVAEIHRPGDLVWGFPAHHLAVATSFYAPEIPVGGGFLAKEGQPWYVLKPGERFTGYRMESQLDRLVEKPEEEILRRAGGRRVLLITYADDDWHGDTRRLVRALAGERRESLERFAAREVLLLRVFDAP